MGSDEIGKKFGFRFECLCCLHEYVMYIDFLLAELHAREARVGGAPLLRTVIAK